MNDPHKTVSTLMVAALVLALAALLAGPAAARPIIDDLGTAPAGGTAVHPNDLGGAQGVGAVTAPQVVVPYMSHGLGVDASDFQGSSGPALTATSSGDNGFAWESASIGGAAALLVLLLGAMGSFALRHRHAPALR
jgi:hypothetical protein